MISKTLMLIWLEKVKRKKISYILWGRKNNIFLTCFLT